MTKEEKILSIEYLIRKAIQGQGAVSIEGIRNALKFGATDLTEEEQESLVDKIALEGILEE